MKLHAGVKAMPSPGPSHVPAATA